MNKTHIPDIRRTEYGFSMPTKKLLTLRVRIGSKEEEGLTAVMVVKESEVVGHGTLTADVEVVVVVVVDGTVTVGGNAAITLSLLRYILYKSHGVRKILSDIQRLETFSDLFF